MLENKQLSLEELDEVSGGRTFSNPDRSAYAEYNREMNCNDCVVGETYLFVSKSDSAEWLFGRIYNSYKRWAVVEYIRILDVIVMDGNKTEVTNGGGTLEITGEYYHTYQK